MWNLVIQLVIAVVLSLLNKPKVDNQRKPSEDEIDLSTSDEARKIPYIAGKVKIEGSNVLWANGFRTEKITQKVKTGIFSSKRQTIGHQIYYGIQHGLCWGDDVELVQIIFNDKVGYENIAGVTEGTYNINKPRLFNGLDSESAGDGVSGNFRFYKGSQEQNSDTYLEATQGESMPAYKNLSYVVFEDFYWGNSTILPQTDFVVTRFPNQILEEQYANINGNANPVEILYELLTDKEKYGLNVDSLDIDIANFIEVGKTLFDEEMGMSLIFNNEYTFDTIKQDIEKHLSCSIYQDLYTGKWKIKLVRDDYNKADLLHFDESNIKNISNYTKPQLSNLLTEVKVIYKDRENNYTKRTATAKSSALALTKNDNSSTTTNYFLFTDSVTAQRVAERDLFFGSNPIISCRIKVNRDGFGLNIGDVIKVSYEELDFVEKVFRVREVDLGTFDDNTITLELVEDFFVYGEPVYNPPELVEYSKIVGEPLPFLELNISAPNFYAKNNTNYNIQMISKFNTLAQDYDAKNISGVYYNLNINQTEKANDTTPISQLKTIITEHQEQIVIKDEVVGYTADLNRLQEQSESDRFDGYNIALITNNVDKFEFISFAGVTYEPESNQYILNDCWRGLLDTIPKTFDINDVVYFLDYGFLLYAFASTPDNSGYRLFNENLDWTGYSIGYQDTLLIDDRPFNNNRRYKNPLNAGDLKVNGVLFTEDQTLNSATSNLLITWKHRNRNLFDRVYKYDDKEHTLEAGVEYTIKIYNEQNSVIKTVNTTSNSFAFSDEETINPNSELYKYLRIELYTTRDSFSSIDRYDFIVRRP